MGLSILPCSGLFLPTTPGGGPPAPPLVPGANPASQYAVAGTTTLTFAFPPASGGTAPYTYAPPTLSATPGSTATVSGTAPGNISINGAKNGESFLLRVYITDADGQEVLNDALGGIYGALAPLPQIVPPARQALASTATSANVTFTQAGAPSGMVYALTVTNITTGATVTPSSGSGLGAWAFPVAAGFDYVATLVGTAPDGQVTQATAQVAVTPVAVLAWAAPTLVSATVGTTTVNIVWNAATGGVAPYVYTDPAPTFDSQSASTTALYSTSGAGAGTTTITGLVNGQSIVLNRTVKDALGESLSVNATLVINAAATGITAGTNPPDQSVNGFTSSVTLGTWGAPSGGTGPYIYAVTNTNGTATISGSGLGPYSASGLSANQAYIFRLEITDSLGAKGYGYVTVTVAAVPTGWVREDYVNFRSADWTAFSSTATTVSTVAWYGELLKADGVTVGAYLRNNANADGRTVSLIPGGEGLRLAASTPTATPAIGVWPPGWSSFLNGNRNDVFLVQAIVKGRQPAGSSAFTNSCGISTTDNPSAPLSGLRVIQSSTGSQVRALSYITGLTEQIYQFFPTGVKREWSGDLQVAIADFRRGAIYFTAGAPSSVPVETGQRVQIQSASAAMTSPGGVQTTSASWGASTLGGRTCFVLYCNSPTVPTADEGIFLQELSLWRFPGGSR